MQSKTYINNQLQQEWITWDPLLRKDLERFEYRLQACYHSMYLTTGANQKMREGFVLPRIIEIIKSMG